MLLKLNLHGEKRYIDSVDDVSYISPTHDDWDKYLKEWKDTMDPDEVEGLSLPSGILMYVRGGQETTVYLYNYEDFIIS